METFQSNEKKPIHVKPNLYTYFMEEMKAIAKEHGYNLLVHGSMNRDLDLIAVPWVDNPKPELTLIHQLDMFLSGTWTKSSDDTEESNKKVYGYSVLPGGRHSYVIQLARQGEWNNYERDLEYYLDISFTPLVV